MPHTVQITADIVRKSFNYGFSHEVTYHNDGSTLHHLVERYNLDRLDSRVSHDRVYFQKPKDLSYSLLIEGDFQPILDFLKNPTESKNRPNFTVEVLEAQ